MADYPMDGLSMGIVILLMTIIVKILVLPTTWKSFISSAKMRALKPYVDKIAEKYPKQEDALKKQQETMALYSQYGVSPMGGCLPMLLQTPVFMSSSVSKVSCGPMTCPHTMT